MKRKILMSTLFTFTVCCVYSFSPGTYVWEELERIAAMNSLRYDYAWTNTAETTTLLKELRDENLSREPQTVIKYYTFSVYLDDEKNGFPKAPAPRTIAEAKLMALYLWETIEYTFIVCDFIMRKEK